MHPPLHRPHPLCQEVSILKIFGFICLNLLKQNAFCPCVFGFPLLYFLFERHFIKKTHLYTFILTFRKFVHLKNVIEFTLLENGLGIVTKQNGL